MDQEAADLYICIKDHSNRGIQKNTQKTPEEYSEDPNNRLGRYSNSAVVQFLNNLVFKKRDEQ